MSIHESSVNFKNLIKDLADIYPYDVNEVILVELIANALDAKASKISIDFDSENNILVVSDDGKGMSAENFDEYHDFAAGLKTRGTGIGFAGVGAKISFNIANKVVTETFSQSFRGGSNWYLKSNKKLIWEDIEPKKITHHGTRVEIHFSKNLKSPYSTTADIEKIVKKHYLPLFDNVYLEMYEKLDIYSKNLIFIINKQVIKTIEMQDYYNLDIVKRFVPKKAGKGIGLGLFGLAEEEYPFNNDMVGVLLCSYGKVIKSDLFNQFPGNIGTRIFGVVEVPEFVNFLTTSKNDLIRNRKSYRKLEMLYSPIRKEFKSWLKELGIQPTEIVSDDEAIKLERELKKLLNDISELSEFFGFRTKTEILQTNKNGIVETISQEGTDITFPDGEGQKGKIGIPGPGENPGEALVSENGGTEKASPISRVSRRGPKISFVEAKERNELAWIDGSNISINCGHPSYIRIQYNPLSKRIHNLFAIANAIQKFILEEDIRNEKLSFIDKMMAAWGEKR